MLDQNESPLAKVFQQLFANLNFYVGFGSRNGKNRDKTLRTVIATMQDLGFVISKADAEVGVVSGSKLAGRNSALLTVTVRDKNDKQIMVRANAQQKLAAVESPEIYQDFFIALEKTMLLKAQQVY